MDNINIKEIIAPYLKQWKWFAACAIIALLIGFAVIRYSVPQYSAEAKIQIIEDQSAGGGIDLFKELDFFSNSSNKVEDEIEIINSRSNFIQIVKDLHLNTQITVLGNIKNKELYSNPPVKLNFIAADSSINKANFDFYLTLSSSTTFGYTIDEQQPAKAYAYGKTIETPIGGLVITPNIETLGGYKNKVIRISIRPLGAVAQAYRSKVFISKADELSSILNISLQDPIKKKARDIIDALIAIYNKNAIEDKKIIADRTSDFINDRIANISSSLSSVDQSAEDLQKSKGIADIASQTSASINASSLNRQQLSEVQNQLNISSSMLDIVEQQDGFEILPPNLGGVSDQAVNASISRYNQLVAERNRLLKSVTEQSPTIQNLDQELNTLKRTVKSSLGSTINNLGLTANTLSGQQAIINSKIYSAPGNQRELRDITRKQQTTESLYLYLLQKREEAQIAVASTAPKSKVIDFAYNGSSLPVSPKKKIIYLLSLFLGLAVPFGFFYLRDLLDNKVHNMHMLSKISLDVPVLGEIPRLTKKDAKAILKEDRSILAESLRIVRTNLDYLMKTNVSQTGNPKRNVIYITSSVSGEGKTFLSTNLSLILASGNKKVLLVGADVRNPKIYTFFPDDENISGEKPKRKQEAGITEYLYDSTLMVKDIVNPIAVNHNSIDVIYSGRIPPNPSELLMSTRLEELLTQVSEQYDYVIVDTAPLMVVTDTLSISKYADHMIYVTRAGVTDLKAIDYPLKLKEDGKINALSFIVNDVKASNLGYGGKYGYGYGKTQKKWWKF